MEDDLNISDLIIGKISDTDAIDRLSSLPEHLISDILSKLDTNSAVATSILSRHWHHQWTYITRFRLYSVNIPNCDELFDFLTTVDNILQKLNSPPTNLRTFNLGFILPSLDTAEDVLLEEADAYDICCEFLPRWFRRICGSHTEQFQVFELRDYLCVDIQNAPLVSSICSHGIESSVVVDTLSLPECLFQSKTLVQLMLTTNLSFKLPHYLHLPNLRRLLLRIYEYDRQLMRTIFKSLPLLQDLNISAFLSGKDYFIDVSAPSLKIFTIKVEGRDSETTVLIDAPKLQHISISISDGLVLFRFVKIPTHLLTTTLSHPGDDVAMLELLKAIRCTRSLRLCCRILNVLNSYSVDELPTFQNFVNLSLMLSDVDNMNVAIPVWILRRVKTVKVEGVIKEYEYDKEMSLLANILSKANVLERLICRLFRNVEETEMESQQKENDFVNALFMLPRVSSCCEIEFIGSVVHASTDDQSTCVM